MKEYFIITLLISLLYLANCDLESTEFSKNFIEYILNNTIQKENMAVAPHAAYELYKELLKPSQPAQSYYYWRDEATTPGPSSALELQSLMSRNLSIDQSNVLYATTMRSRWGFNFQSRDILKKQFYQYGSGDHRKLADFLRKDFIFSFWQMDEFNATVLELPLHLSELRCLIMLPNEYVSLEELKMYLRNKPEAFMELQTKTLPMKMLRVLLPKFLMTYKQDLKEFYKEYSNDTDFENYDSIYHETSLQANVFGIGQFDRTTVLFWNTHSYLRVIPQIIEINRPFLFMITNKENIEFFGQVVKL